MGRMCFFSEVVVKKLKHLEYDKDIQSNAGLAGHRKTYHPDLQRENLTDSSFILR